MFQKKYLKEIKAVLSRFPAKYFIFGSCLERAVFNDIDIGVTRSNDRLIAKLNEAFEGSTIPYKIDLINIDRADQSFKDKVLSGNILWLT